MKTSATYGCIYVLLTTLSTYKKKCVQIWSDYVMVDYIYTHDLLTEEKKYIKCSLHVQMYF